MTIPDELQQDPAAANPDQIWSVIPAEAEAFSVVRNMEDLSEKVDQVAGIMNLEPLRLLDKASEESKILDGLARDGSLAWVKMPLGTGGRSGRTGFLYFVPTTDFETMIEPIMKGAFDALPLPTANLHPVEMNEWSGFAAELKQYGVFAFADDRKTVSAALASERSALGEVIPFDDWGTNVDGYFVLTDQGIRSGLRQFEIPFSTPSLESMLDLVRTSALVSRQFAAQDLPDLAKPLRQLAVGLELDPNRGVAVRSRLWLDPAIDLNESMSESPGGRERSLNLLPDARFLIAIGGPVSAKQCEMLSTQLGQSFPNQRKPEISLNAFQFALLAPDPIPADGEPRLPAKTLNAFERYYDCLILTATVPNAQTALKDIETWFAAFDQIAQQNDGVNPLERLVAIESRDLQGVPVLQITMAADAQQILPMLAGVRLNIAAANGETLVCTLGGDEQLTRALAPSRGAASMSESAAVRAAVRMLPESTSSIAVTDLSRVIQEVMYRGRQDHAQWLFEQLGLEPEVPFPVALGVSWRQSELDIQLSIPVETLPLLGRVPTFFPWLQFRFQ